LEANVIEAYLWQHPIVRTVGQTLQHAHQICIEIASHFTVVWRDAVCTFFMSRVWRFIHFGGRPGWRPERWAVIVLMSTLFHCLDYLTLHKT